MSYRLLPAIFALALSMLVGCKEQAGVQGNVVHAATTQTVYCYVAGDQDPSGHIDGYQGDNVVWDHFDYN